MQAREAVLTQPRSKKTLDGDPISATLMTAPYVGIGRLLRETHMSFHRLFTAELAAHGVGFGEFQHLQHLWDADGITQVELAARIGNKPAASTAILAALEERGYIRRVRNDIDRRKVNVYLTPKGHSTKKSLLKCAQETNAIARKGLSDAKLDELFHTMRHLLVNTRNAAASLTAPEVQS
jgi:MarR family transcriptional regulator, organic hydroperoxide resistance regulator